MLHQNVFTYLLNFGHYVCISVFVTNINCICVCAADVAKNITTHHSHMQPLTCS